MNRGDSLQRVGLKKPNDFGLFDVYGNCLAWCMDEYGNYPEAKGKPVEDEAGKLEIVNTNRRVLRGGSFFFLPSHLRSAYRTSFVPTYRSDFVGLRPARTILP